MSSGRFPPVTPPGRLVSRETKTVAGDEKGHLGTESKEGVRDRRVTRVTRVYRVFRGGFGRSWRLSTETGVEE